MTSLFTLLVLGLLTSSTPVPPVQITNPVPLSLPYATDFDNGFPADWVNDPLDGAEDWISSDSTNSTYGPNAADHTSGNGQYLWVDDSSPNSATINLITPCFDLTGNSNPTLSYWLWSQNENSGAPDAILHFDVESNGVWTQDAFAPISSNGAGWMQIQENLTTYTGTIVRIRFRVEEVGSGFQHDIAIDDFSIFELSPVDMGVISLVAPASIGCFGTTEQVTVQLVNFGSAPISFSTTPLPIGLTISGASTVNLSETLSTGTLPAGDTLLYSFTNTVNLSVSGIHSFEVFTLAVGDGNALNDTLIATVAQGVVAIAPFFEDFEGFGPGFANGWLQSTTDNQDWAIGTDGVPYTANTGPINDHTTGGNTYLFTEASAPAQPGDIYDLLSPCISTSALGIPTLSFWYHLHGADIGSLEVAVLANGNANTVFTISGPQQTAETDPWQQAIIPIAGFGDTLQLRFRGIRGNGIQGDIAIDDIRIDALPNRDLSLTALVSPADPACLGASESLTLELRNTGGLPIDFATDPATLTIDIAGPLPQTFSQSLQSGVLAPFASLQSTFSATADFSTEGIYTLQASLGIANDANVTNDSLVATRTRILPDTLPLSLVNFTDYTGNNLGTFYPGWYEAEGSSLPASAGSSWTADDFANNTSSANGESARIRLSDTGDQDWLVSPSFLATAQTVVCYQVALTQAFGTGGASLGSDDSLSVMVSTDCGASFTPVFTYSGTSSLSNTGQMDTVNLGSFAGNEVIIAFYASEGTIDNFEDVDLFLDNIQVKEVFSTDIELISIDRPQNSCGLTANELITITYANRGAGVVTTVLARFSADGLPFTAPVFLPAIGPGDTLGYVFNTTADFSLIGPHSLSVVASAGNPADLNRKNDTIHTTIHHLPVISTFPYLEEFENGNGSWFASGEKSTWALGTPAKTTIIGAASGLNAWTTGGLDTTRYAPKERSFVTSPCFDLTQLSDAPYISMKIWWEAEFSWDGALLQSSTDGGSNWKKVGEFGDPDNWYTDNTINSNPGYLQPTGSEDGWTGRSETNDGSGGWVQAIHPIDPMLIVESAVQFRIAFAADGTFEDDGFAFDNVAIGSLPEVDLGPDLSLCPTGDSLNTGLTGTHLWSTGATTPGIALINTTGITITDSLIWVQYTDSLGLTGSDSILVTILGAGPDVTASQSATITCPGDSTGAAVAFIIGNGPFSINWNTQPAQTTPVATNLPAGIYTVSVSDQVGCVTVDSVEVLGPPPFVVQIDSINILNCANVPDGQLQVSVSGGTPPYLYNWSNGATSEDITGLSPGTYTLSITDDAGCAFAADPQTITALDSLPVADFEFTFQTNALIAFTENTSANATSFAWDFGDGQGTSTAANPNYTYAANGSYLVTLIASNACGSDTFSQTVSLTQVSIQDDLLGAIRLYPNPNTGTFTLEFGELPLQDVNLSLRDALGREVFSQKRSHIASQESLLVQLPALPTGTYLLEIKTPDAVQRFSVSLQ